MHLAEFKVKPRVLANTVQKALNYVKSKNDFTDHLSCQNLLKANNTQHNWLLSTWCVSLCHSIMKMTVKIPNTNYLSGDCTVRIEGT